MITREIDWRSPRQALVALSADAFSALLHAGDAAAAPGWSVIAAFPKSTLETRGRGAFIDGAAVEGDPFDILHTISAARRTAADDSLGAPLKSGLLGFVGYEAGSLLEPTAAGPASPFGLPDMAFGAYDALALFDRQKRQAVITAHTDDAADRLYEALGDRTTIYATDAPTFGPIFSNFTEEEYRRAVSETIERIRNGDLFQANIAQQLQIETSETLNAFHIFRLFAKGDAPFGAYLQYAEGAVVSASPERFFKITPDGEVLRILAEPIKGTRPRGQGPASDWALAEALLADPKDRAENIMIADLTRNDLSRICRDGSIREEAVCALESFATVHHLVSRISGRMSDGLGAVDALKALFPCGSITGAPKVEAMKTIADIERKGRGPYCGAIGYIDDRGAADFSVAIRTMIVDRSPANSRVTIPVGGGVTLRSDPQAEYQETLDKAAGILRALEVKERAAA